MHKGRVWLISLLLLIFCFIGGRIDVTYAQRERLVLAFYCTGFDWDTWMMDLPDKPAQLYLSADPTVVEVHLQQALRAGIDALIMDWHGPEIVGANQSELNFRILLDQAVAYDLSAAVSVHLDDLTSQGAEDVQAALMTLKDRHISHLAYLRVDGRPVLFFVGTERYPLTTWHIIRNQVDPERAMIWITEETPLAYLEVFDGMVLSSLAQRTVQYHDPVLISRQWGNKVRDWAGQHNVFRYWIATVIPGYDNSVIEDGEILIHAREDGDYYRATWDAALQSDADWVIISSFNRWLEGSQIEPSVTYGDFYLDLTAEMGTTYRHLSFEVPTSTPTLTPTMTSVVTPTPTIVTPTATATPEPTFTPEPTLTPTITPSPTATPFVFPTPLPTPTPTLVPTIVIPQGPVVTSQPRTTLTATPYPRRMPVEGYTPKSCWPLLACVPLGLVLMWLLVRQLSL